MLVLGGSGALTAALVRRLRDGGAGAEAFAPANDADARQALERASWTAVAVVTDDDALALRLTLLCAHLRPDLRLWATLFDRTVVHRLRSTVPQVRIVSPAEIAAASLADACVAAGARPRRRWLAGTAVVDDPLRLLVRAGAGLLVALLVQIAISIPGLHENFIDALFFSVRVLATITDSPRADGAAAWFKLVSTLDTLVTVVLLAVFTAALVRVLSRTRLTTVLGPRRAPARDHVLVVGFGQVGFRLAQILRQRRIPVLGLERDVAAPAVRIAPATRLPVAVGSGEDRTTLERVGVARCAVLACVTSDDLTNVAVGLAASDLSPATPLVLRLGDGDVAAETESLLHLGEICDVHDIVARALASEILEDVGESGGAAVR